MVGKGGLEPPRLAAPAPKAGASANSATSADQLLVGQCISPRRTITLSIIP